MIFIILCCIFAAMVLAPLLGNMLTAIIDFISKPIYFGSGPKQPLEQSPQDDSIVDHQ
jgi:hypothetical protein